MKPNRLALTAALILLVLCIGAHGLVTHIDHKTNALQVALDEARSALNSANSKLDALVGKKTR